MPSEHAPWWIPHHEIRYFDGTQMIVESFEPIDKSILPWWKLPGVIIFKGEVVRRIAEPGD